MAVSVRIPHPLRKLTGEKTDVETVAGTIAELIDSLETQHPGIKERLVDATGKIHRFVNLYVNDDDIRFLGGVGTPLKDGDNVAIVPAVAGGSPCLEVE